MPQTQAEVEELPREWGEPWTIDTAEYVRFSCYDAQIMNEIMEKNRNGGLLTFNI